MFGPPPPPPAIGPAVGPAVAPAGDPAVAGPFRGPPAILVGAAVAWVIVQNGPAIVEGIFKIASTKASISGLGHSSVKLYMEFDAKSIDDLPKSDLVISQNATAFFSTFLGYPVAVVAQSLGT